MEPSPRPEPWPLIVQLLKQVVADDVVGEVERWVLSVTNPTDRVVGNVSVVMQDDTLEAYGTVHPPTVTLDVHSAVHRVTSDTVTLTPGPPHPSGSAVPRAWRRDLLIAAVICFVVLSFHDQRFNDGLVEALRELFLILIALSAPNWWSEG